MYFLRVGGLLAWALVAALAATAASDGVAARGAGNAVPVGSGFVDASVRQVVRTAGGRVYIFAADDTEQRQAAGPGVIRAWKGNRLGIPTGFSEVDAANRPSATGDTHVLGSPDVRLDERGVAHLVYVDETNGTLVYRTFSTRSDCWGAAETLATGVNVPETAIKRAATANALVLDAAGSPHVVYVAGSSILYRTRAGGRWSAPVTVATGGSPLHPSLAFDRGGNLHLVWLDDAGPRILYRMRTRAGAWRPEEVVAAADVLSNANLDQGPSVVVTRSGTPYTLYVSALPASAVRVESRTARGWSLDGPPYDLYTHTPQIYSQGDDIYVFLGHDEKIRFGYAYRLSGRPWSSYFPLTSESQGKLDGSASVRWDPQRETDRNVIDVAFFDEDRHDDGRFLPQLYYMAVKPARPASRSR